MRRLFLAVLAATSVATSAYAQSNAPGPFDTRSGKLEFVRVDRDVEAKLDGRTFDRIHANTLEHFDDMDSATGAIARSLVQTDSGPVLYDFRERAPLVQRTGTRIAIRRVFWQRDEVVMQGAQGWFRLKGGVLTKLQSSVTTYH
jgi:hypothetical protein